MAERRAPLPELLRPQTFERAQVERIWGAIAAERAAQQERGRARGLGLGGKLGFAFVLAAGAAVAVLALGVPSDAPEPTPSGQSSAASLTRSDGSAFESIAAEGARPVRVALSDGSALDVAPGGLIVPVELTARRVVLRLQRGTTRFAVRPGGPRRWVVEAGPARVEVIGTRFEVARGADGTHVRVEEGKVEVHGAGLPGGLVQLTVGQEVTVPTRAGAQATVRSTPAAGTVEPPSGAAEAPLPEAALAGEPRRAPVDRGSSAHTPPPAPTPANGVEALLAEADRLRMAREHAAAARVLERVLNEHASDPRAGLAAFTLGRLREQALADARGAATAYARALELGLSGPLAQSARGHLARTLFAAGLREEAAHAAREYLTRHPRGPDAAAMQALLDKLSALPADTAR
jgi:transmembrane sensor